MESYEAEMTENWEGHETAESFYDEVNNVDTDFLQDMIKDKNIHPNMKNDMRITSNLLYAMPEKSDQWITKKLQDQQYNLLDPRQHVPNRPRYEPLGDEIRNMQIASWRVDEDQYVSDAPEDIAAVERYERNIMNPVTGRAIPFDPIPGWPNVNQEMTTRQYHDTTAAMTQYEMHLKNMVAEMEFSFDDRKYPGAMVSALDYVREVSGPRYELYNKFRRVEDRELRDQRKE